MQSYIVTVTYVSTVVSVFCSVVVYLILFYKNAKCFINLFFINTSTSGYVECEIFYSVFQIFLQTERSVWSRLRRGH